MGKKEKMGERKKMGEEKRGRERKGGAGWRETKENGSAVDQCNKIDVVQLWMLT